MDRTPLAEATIVRRVEEGDLASLLGDLPPVLATTRMIAFMELAGAKCLEPLLGDGETSVGVDVQVRHAAATPAGVEVRCSARFLHAEGKLHWFEVWAEDPGGEIGRGRHSRAIVQAARILSGATRRTGG